MTEVSTQMREVSVGGAVIDMRMKLSQLPLRDWNFANCPAIPFWADEYGDPDLGHVLKTVSDLDETRGRSSRGGGGGALDGLHDRRPHSDRRRVSVRHQELCEPSPRGGHEPAASGRRTAHGSRHRGAGGRAARGGAPAPSPADRVATRRSESIRPALDQQGSVRELSQNLLPALAGFLTDEQVATETFWPSIASFGLPFNLLVLKKLPIPSPADLADELIPRDRDAAAGPLYEIDMRHIGSLEPATLIHPDGSREVRFAPGTRTLLEQNSTTKALTPVGIEILQKSGPPLLYKFEDPAWLYALQAAKTSIAVHGTWLGHVYPWHIVTAAMQMTMYNTLPPEHRLRPLLVPQSEYLIDFDFALLMFLWGKITPPTPVSGYMPLLRLLDDFADGRSYFADDPRSTLKRQNISPADFTVENAWDAYPVAGFLLEIWDATKAYVTAVVGELYKTDGEVEEDEGLKAWIQASSDPARGNIKGLTPLKTKQQLIDLLTSLLHRVTAHGASSLTPSVNPALSFVPTLPPCLQSDKIPALGHTPEQRRTVCTPSSHRHHRCSDQLLLHLRLHQAVRSVHPGRRCHEGTLLPAATGTAATRR